MSCGGGTQRYTRTVVVQAQHGGQQCTGSDVKDSECYTNPCLIFPPASSCSRANFEEEGDYFEGDMILPSDVAKNHINNAIRRWPGGIVPYVIEGTFGK